MKMVPGIPHPTNSMAEMRVFDNLRAAFRNDPTLTAYHSLNLTGHAYKRFGEIDFLVCGKDGLFVLEVKGGRISCDEGVWCYTNRFDHTAQSVEGPFRQAESALHALVNKLRKNLSQSVVSQFIIGYGVIFPDCEWHVSGAEWDPQLVADARAFKRLEAWMSELFKYWRCREGRQTLADTEALNTLKHYLRPQVEVATPLYIQSGLVEEDVMTLTEDQMEMVDVVDANERVLCSGGAGTGKTFLALELARRWASEGKHVLLVCRSNWLRRFLESKIVSPGLSVSSIDSAHTAAIRMRVERFDALIVDEGQDLMDMESLDQLDGLVKYGLEHGRWCFFYDVNNQSGLIGAVDPEAVAYLNGCNVAHIPLRTNCRNTHVILKKVQEMLGADMGVRGAGNGPKVREHEVGTREESAEVLLREINEIVDDGGIPPGSVTILSSLPFEASSAALLPRSILRNIRLLDEFSLRSFPPAEISFAEISHFKGLENEAIIIVDLERPNRKDGMHPMHYVGMSRARAVLSLIFTRFPPNQPT
jgi:hypothetical protein